MFHRSEAEAGLATDDMPRHKATRHSMNTHTCKADERADLDRLGDEKFLATGRRKAKTRNSGAEGGPNVGPGPPNHENLNSLSIVSRDVRLHAITAFGTFAASKASSVDRSLRLGLILFLRFA